MVPAGSLLLEEEAQCTLVCTIIGPGDLYPSQMHILLSINKLEPRTENAESWLAKSNSDTISGHVRLRPAEKFWVVTPQTPLKFLGIGCPIALSLATL